jgi:hypothetical protein
MSIYKNILKRPIKILINGIRKIVLPGQKIEGGEELRNYAGLLKIEPKNHIEKENNNIIGNTFEKYFGDIKIETKNRTITNEEIMEKVDLTDVTFNIPIAIESEDRKNNLTLILDYIGKYFNTNVIICESSEKMIIKDFWKPEWSSFVRVLFAENKTQFFYKTKLLNELAKMSKTEIIVSYDSDVILSPSLYIEAAKAIRNKEYDFCYPFNKPLKHIKKENFPLIRDTLDVSIIDPYTEITHPGVPPGGCFFMNREKFISVGMENENMISWGPEDQERLYRVRKLGYTVGALNGSLYHLDHHITPNSFYTNPIYHKNVDEFNKIQRMSLTELNDYIKTFYWGKK